MSNSNQSGQSHYLVAAHYRLEAQVADRETPSPNHQGRYPSNGRTNTDKMAALEGAGNKSLAASIWELFARSKY